MMHSGNDRVIEILAWAGGIILIAVQLGTGAWSSYASDAAMDAMRAVRADGLASAALAEASPQQPPSPLSSTQPDTSTWSAKRLAEYRATLQSTKLPEAILHIPKLALEVPVFPGTGRFALNRGAGRIEGTAEAGSSSGNIGIAAHRDGFFRPLKDIAVGDRLSLETRHDIQQFAVASIRIVEPSDVSVLDPTPDTTITLVTCYPFYYVGSAPKRFIVHARLVVEDVARGRATL
jgi:sortase A